jgi:hypothetical protein
MFAATHPDAWMIGPDGVPAFAGVCGGAICSLYAPATAAFFQEAVERMLEKWPLQGIIWDEIKVLAAEDHSPHAIRALGEPSRGQAQIQRTVDFFSQASRVARAAQPDITLSCFIYAHQPDHIMRACAGIDELDYFGIDGRCWPSDDPGAKVLFGNMERALAASRSQGVGSLALIETQTPGPDEPERTLAHLPAFLDYPVDHLLYYYHGASRVDEDWLMEGMGRRLRAWRREQVQRS